MIKIWTAQNKEVLNIINSSGVYIPDESFSKYYQGKGKLAYDLIINKINAFPIFGIVTYIGNRVIFNDDINRLSSDIPFSKDNVLFELEMKDNDVLLTDYYNWVDILYYYQDANDLEKKELYYASTLDHCLQIKEGRIVQSIIKSINKNNIKNVYKGANLK